MDEQKTQELNLEEMDKVSGGTGSDLCKGMKFYELSLDAQSCAEDGYCPNCNPQREGYQWFRFDQNKWGFHCRKCGFHITKA